MKIWMENNFSKEHFCNKNLKDIGVFIYTRFSNIKDDYKDWFDVDFEDEDDDCKVCVPYIDIDDILDDGTDYEYCDWYDTLEYEMYLEASIKSFPHYLVCAYNSNWMGQTGYKFANTITGAFARNYDTQMYIIGGSKGGKSVLINEYSHDCPTGANTIVIGLTEKEFDKLNNMCYNKIIDFADKHYESIIRF